ncbi:MAG: DUF2863 family protein [Rhodocyclaceae bacterium]|nr:DUF2863 family protein [Rhodocyclaceae bacterium]
MKRPRFTRRSKQTPDTEHLIRLAMSLSQSSSRIEDAFWETRLATLVDRLLADGDEAALTGALDHLYGVGGRAYDELADTIESCCESRHIDAAEGVVKHQDVLLIAAPVLAWSRYTIPSGPIAAEALSSARVHLQAHVLAKDARLGLANFLFSPDQLPQSYAETAALAEKLAKAALHGRDVKLDPGVMPETVNFLSDTRYLIGAVAATRGTPMFRWQEEDGSRADSIKQWRLQGGDALRPLLPACATELLLPQPYHAAAREADRASRPYSLRAAVAFLQTTLNVAATDLRAVVAPFYDRQIEEYRVGFTLSQATDVVHGVVWPLLEAEDESSDAPAQIELVLREAGMKDIVALDDRFPLEYCDDCGAPLYPNPEGEPVHAELPEEQAETAPRHLH